MIEIFQDIRKIYTFCNPCEELAAHIEFFSESSLTKTRQYIGYNSFTVKMFPSFTPTFYINLGAPYSITLGGRPHVVQSDQDILILRDNIVERCNLPTDNIFTVKFNPGGLEAVLGINQVYCTNQVIPLHTIIPASLLRQIRRPINFEERAALMQNYLLSRYQKKGYQDHYLKLVSEAIGTYDASGLQLNTSAVAEKLFITSKTINRYFNRVVGIPPKRYFNLLRTRTALTAFVKDQAVFVPFNYGYYDISHFNKDVLKFTGQKLTRHGL